MERAKVAFTDFRTRPNVSQGEKLKNLCIKAGIKNIDFEEKFVAIKLHFGELGNFAYIRPNYVKAVADLVKSLGGKPFLTDCNTLYPGSRKNAVDHLLNADIDGFNYMTTGCHNIIADGIKGTDGFRGAGTQRRILQGSVYRAGLVRRGYHHCAEPFQGA